MPPVLDELLWWADGVSALLLCLMYTALPLPPHERLWPRCGELFWWYSVIILNFAWNVSRLIIEGIHEIEVPRDFLMLAIVYCVVWLTTLKSGWNQERQVFRRGKCIARAMAKVSYMREGKSTSEDRFGEWEVVVKKGCSKALWPWLTEEQITAYVDEPTVTLPNGTRKAETKAERRQIWLPHIFQRNKAIVYWGGDETSVATYSRRNEVNVSKVRLSIPEMHRTALESFMLPGRLSWINTEDVKADLYKAVYDVAYLSCRSHADHPYLTDMWPKKWSPLSVEHLAQQSECDDLTVLGGIARRIAADATYFVFFHDEKSTCRTEEQVKALNVIVEAIANAAIETRLGENDETLNDIIAATADSAIETWLGNENGSVAKPQMMIEGIPMAEAVFSNAIYT